MTSNRLFSKVESEGAASTTGASVGQRWRLRRNLVIYISSQQGVPQRWLADVFDLPPSRICAILKEFRAREVS